MNGSLTQAQLDRMLSVDEAAARIRVSRSKIVTMYDAGQLPSSTHVPLGRGRHLLIEPSDLEPFRPPAGWQEHLAPGAVSDEWLTPTQVAEKLGVSRRTVYYRLADADDDLTAVQLPAFGRFGQRVSKTLLDEIMRKEAADRELAERVAARLAAEKTA